MNRANYIPPTLDKSSFNCAACGVLTKQTWYYLRGSSGADGFGHQFTDHEFRVSHCEYCDASTIWLGDQMIYPDHGPADPPNPDLPEDVCADYLEAARIVSRSPRGAAALLRLCIQKLCIHLGKPGNSINEDIKLLVQDGLPKRVQQALDSVRVIGNEAVHPGELDLRDDRDTALSLFRLVNFIAEKMITEDKEVDEIFQSLPESKRTGIENRDKESQS